MDFGKGNTSNRRQIKVTEMAKKLECIHYPSKLSKALVCFHVLTEFDFTSAFYKEGKITHFIKLEKTI